MRLRETRQIVIDRNISAFRPGVTPQPLTVRPRGGVEIKRAAEPRRVVVPGGETRPGGAGPAIEQRKIKPVEKPEKKVPVEGIKPGGSGSGIERKVGPIERQNRTVPGEGIKPRGTGPAGGIQRESGPGGAARKTPGYEGGGGPVRKEGPSGKSD